MTKAEKLMWKAIGRLEHTVYNNNELSFNIQLSCANNTVYLLKEIYPTINLDSAKAEIEKLLIKHYKWREDHIFSEEKECLKL
ncbi:hypothetical protein E9863_10820 [Salmonella enterica]|uniref:hypothetical protein n=1 Tax=Salmonella enterica TaxID=28901 RepID=UPI00111A9E12|nr:hypothetical protein [Salmonella enterica]EAV6171738.1 hypothetical protein [Salmonella enterica subsp. enterica serovar Havana]